MHDWLWILQDAFGLLRGKVHSHHPHPGIEDENLENKLIENDEDEVEPLDKYDDNIEEPDVEEMDEQLANPRSFQRK